MVIEHGGRTRQFDTTAFDSVQSVAVDASGYVYIAGYTGGALPGQGSYGSTDAFVRDYDVNGNTQ